MSEATSLGRFVFDLPHTEAALALAGGPSSQTLRQLEATEHLCNAISLVLDVLYEVHDMRQPREPIGAPSRPL